MHGRERVNKFFLSPDTMEKATSIFETEYSRMDQVKFVEDSL